MRRPFARGNAVKRGYCGNGELFPRLMRFSVRGGEMGKVQEAVLETVRRSCYSGQCNGKSTFQKVILRKEEGQPDRRVVECTECQRREAAPGPL